MSTRWWEAKEYQLGSGRWAPRVHPFQVVPGWLEATRLLGPEGRTFPSRAGAKKYWSAMAATWPGDLGESW
jgi:hypothetical protein